ncbi:hypothetical protein Tco_1057444 [Tanacetum coccineum]|uniref:Uncharacterized protein n=1 Tax=Tanacetum coccineum TaxID=301880 RepID=A0ABQ5H5D7_9ASTR
MWVWGYGIVKGLDVCGRSNEHKVCASCVCYERGKAAFDPSLQFFKNNHHSRWRRKSVVEKKDELMKAGDEEIENLKAHMLLKEAEAAEAIRLRAEASNFETMEKSLRDEVNALKERNTILEKERNALDVKATDLEASTMDKERELTNLNFQLTSVKSRNDNLVDQVHELEVSSAGLQERLSKMALHLEEKLYPHLLTAIFGCMWLLTHDMELAIVNCLNSPEYLSALGAAVGKALEKGMQDGLSAGIIHGKEGRLQSVNFSLLSKLKSNKDASIETVMDFLRLENPLSEKLGLTELQPHVDQLMKIRENIANHKSTIRDVFVPLAGPFSAVVLTGTEGTSNTMDATANITTTLSTTLASASSVPPISIDDYEVADADGQVVADENVASFPNVDDVDLNIPQ